MDRKGVILIVLGLVLALASGFADPIGLGDDRGFHYRQGIGVGLGVAAVVAGVVIAVRSSRGAAAPDSADPSR